ncbi:centromere protein L-like [Coregonus clupeaformis]|uniref:centromere protein L-like n=1 Tax=Coregonus clupeaformis TaxID=59861 RepID=UPI001BDFF56D|nr:centromere protein L-like [Coregonus clupeaformis]
MEERNSTEKTPLNNVLAQRRSKSYRRSMRSCVEATHLAYTSGHLTALRIPRSRSAPKSRDITKQVDPDQVALLVKKEWQLSYVTPLYQFRHTQLKPYSKQLSAFIVSEKQQGLAIEVGQELGFKVNFSVVLGLAETDKDAETVFIQILSKQAFAAKDDAQKVVWSGWLTCVNGDLDYLRSLPPEFVSLPLLCTRGPESLTVLVKSWFEKTFDCCFGPLGINSTNLQWLASLWTGCHPTINIQYLKLVWTLPTLPPMDVTYTVDPQDAWELWDSVRQVDTTEDSISIDEVTRFIKGLQSHFFRHFRIDLSAGSLMQISTALGSSHHSGKIKIASPNYIPTILQLLTECALLKMPI